MSFGERIKEARNIKGLTQEQLAELVGVGKTTITGYEIGNREPDVIKIKKIAAALSVSADYLLETEPESIQNDSRVDSLIACFFALDDNGKESLLAAAQGMRMAQEVKRKNDETTQEVG